MRKQRKNARNPQDIGFGSRVSAVLDNPPWRFLATLFAHTINLEGVAASLVVVFATDLLLQFIHFRREELNRAAAVGADHVVMAAAVVLVLITRDAVVKGHFAGESALGKKFEGAVH